MAAEPFEQQQFGTTGVEWVNTLLPASSWVWDSEAKRAEAGTGAIGERAARESGGSALSGVGVF